MLYKITQFIVLFTPIFLMGCTGSPGETEIMEDMVAAHPVVRELVKLYPESIHGVTGLSRGEPVWSSGVILHERYWLTFHMDLEVDTQRKVIKYSDPEFSWRFTVAPTAIEFLNSEIYGKDYQNDVFIGDVHGRIYHFELNEKRDGFVFSDELLNDLVADSQNETKSIIFGENLGIIVDIKTGPDGYLYVLSMVHADTPGWLIYASHARVPDLEKQGAMMGVIFRLIPSSLISEFEEASPRQQISSGILSINVTCQVGLELIFKVKDNSPACVKPLSIEKLVNRGWATI